MESPLFSIIVPVYNAEKYIDECIQSVIDSTYKNWELMLVDDGSTDKSGSVCDDYVTKDNRIKVIHKSNGGVSSARNVGIENTTGEYLTFVDSDDRIAPTMLEKIVSTFSETNADIVFTDFNIIYPEKSVLFSTYPWTSEKDGSFRNYLTHSWPRVSWGALKREIILDIRYPENLTIFEDFHFMCRVILQSTLVVRIAEPLYEYRIVNENSITSSLSLERREQDERWVYQDLFCILKEKGLFDYYAPAIYWKLLYKFQYLVLSSSFDEFRSFFPDKRKHILSCPTINKSMKFMMWCITHKLAFIVTMILKLKNVIYYNRS